MSEDKTEQAAQAKAEAVKDDEHHVVLRVTAPAYCTKFILPGKDGDTLEVSRAGTKVATSKADSVKAAAAACGVTLVEVS